MKHRLKPLLASLLTAFAASSAYADNTTVHFDIQRFDVRGNTLLSAQTLDSAVAPFLGKQRDFADVMGAVEAIEAEYHAKGYQLVRIDLPEQELNQGVVILNVVQTKVGNVVVEGNQNFSDANIRNSLPGLREGETPDLARVSKSLKLANENPAKKTVMKMKSGAVDGEVDATLTVADESVWLTTLNLDNTGTEQIGKTYASVILQNANMFGQDHVMSLQYTTTMEKSEKVSIYGIGYHVPLYALGDSMDFFASYADVDAGVVPITVGTGVADFALTGKGTTYGARYNQNLPTASNYESKLIYGVDYKAFKNGMLSSGIEFGSDVTVHPVSVGYQGNWTLPTGVVNSQVTLLHNIPGGSHGSQADFDRSDRSNANADYTALRFSVSTTQALPEDWLGRVLVNGQYSNDALISAEQFGAGGSSSVRGFQEREVANDSGVAANFEVYSSPLCRNTDWQCRVLAFYDAAYLTRNHALPGEFTSIAISSIGVGVRLQLRNNINFQVDYGHVLHAEASATQKGDERLHARLGLSF